ncbi:MAG: TonB-dependent receptor [Xanthomonadales bacterium]|jgi:outer membrane receptor protein involved in Fe transport|nr:TonB-dependent receptor [Xanthomonadales bacterium]
MKKRNLFTLTLAIQAALFAPQMLAQTDTEQAGAEQEAGEIEEVIVTGSQIRGAAINDALSVSVVDVQAIDAFGIESGEELLDAMPEQGQNFFNEAENISGGVNSARGDIGAFNLRNIGTGNTLVLMNGRRVVNSATYQTEEVGGSFVPVNTANSAVIPVFGLSRVEVLRDGASAIYGADAVAGVVNTVMKDDYDGFSVRARYTSYDNIPRDDGSLTIEWGDVFNEGRTSVGVFVNYYGRDRVNSQDDPKWADSDYRRLVDEDSPWFGSTAFRNDSANSNWGQYDLVKSMSGDPYGLRARGIVDSSGEFETYPVGDERCEGGYIIADNVCGHVDGQGTYRYNLNENRDLVSELDRFNSYAYFNHEFANGMEAYTEFSWYQSSTNLIRHPSYSFSSVKLRVSADNYWNPLGPCGSPNRLSEDVIGPDVPCEGLEMTIDNYRWAEVPRIVDTDSKVYRILQGLRGSIGMDWDWDSAIMYSKAERNDVTHNRISNNLMQEALSDPTSAAYNPFGGGVNTNVERALVDVRRDSETDLFLVDFKISNIGLFDLPWSGPVGFMAGAEYRKESFKDDRDPRLDGTIPFTDWEGDTYPFVSDVINSSPTPDSEGDRSVTSLFTEFAIPLLNTLDLQLALRYENFSDVGSTTVPKVAFGWRPTNWFMLRGSWSQAFRAPNLVTINEGLVVRNNTRTDYTCQYAAEYGGDPDQDILDCRNTIQRRAFGNDQLKPEKSDNYSVGVVLNPIDNVTLTLDFWKIEKKDTIGLFGEENHTLLDLVMRLEGGGCSGNPVLGRTEVEDDYIPIYEAAGLCPAGDLDYVNDIYENLDTRIVEGFDFGVYYDLETGIGDWDFTWVGSVYTKYDQEPGGAAQVLFDAQEAGIIPSNYPVEGFDDILRMDGNQEQKMNARINWRRNDWSANLAWFYLSDFYQSSLTLEDGTRWVVPSMSTFNASADYRFDMFGSRSRVRLGVRNLTNERAPLADRYFGYFSDAHSDLGRSYYIDFRMAW